VNYLDVKLVHILSSTLLFGTGIGSAFYLLFATMQRDPRAVAVVARGVVIADNLFTATTAILQPLTGWYMVHLTGMPWHSAWLRWSIALYVLALACWLPVVAIQLRLRRLAQQAMLAETVLPPAYWRWFKVWCALGVPAFFAFMGIFYLMVVKPL
jgi:uncharacterized membrane protein